jgi:hypothetical protein
MTRPPRKSGNDNREVQIPTSVSPARVIRPMAHQRAMGLLEDLSFIWILFLEKPVGD